MLMSPHDVAEAKAVYREQRCALLAVSENAEMLRGLEVVEELVEAKRYYDALRKIRALFDIEQSILMGAELLEPVELA
jgi:flagellar protein FlbT